METSCPNSPFDEEHFEFVDYTAASQWERFITTVEEVLTGWGVNEGQLGIFDESRLSPLHDKIYIKKVGGIDPFVKRETIILDDNSYTLSYHYHPINRWNELIPSSSTSQTPPTTTSTTTTTTTTTTTISPSNYDPFLPSSEFLPLTLPNSSRDLSSVKLCEIHRWTGLTHILVLSLSDMFSFDSISKSSKIDLSTTKMLLSSFAIAFHNIKCKLPVFVPTGGLYNSPLYTGYMCLYKQEDSNDASDLGEAEIRFNTTYIRDVPTRYSNLESLTELFIEKMDLKQFSLDQTAIEHEIDKIPHLGITVSGLFTYELQNLDTHDWRRIIYDYDYVTSNRLSNNKDLTFDNDDVLLNKFNDKNETILGDLVLKNISGYSNPSNDQFSSSPVKNSSSSSSSRLTFGPHKDPLESMLLAAFFPSASNDSYLENNEYSEMDAVKAQIWLLSCNFSQDDSMPNSYLTSVLSEVTTSWCVDLDKGNLYGTKFFHKGEKQNQIYELPGSFNNYDLDSYNIKKYNSGGIVDMDDVVIDNILQELFNPLRNKFFAYNNNNYNNNKTGKINTKYGIQLLSTASLGLNFQHVRTVPYKSFLWNLLECLLETISPVSNSRYCSFLGSLKILWTEVLKNIRSNWERFELIPDVNIYNLSEFDIDSSSQNKSNLHNSKSADNDNSSNGNSNGNCGISIENANKKSIGIDMRYNIIHQKLNMINCCISRIRQSNNINNNNSNSSPTNNSFTSISPNSITKSSNKSSVSDPKQLTFSDPLVRLFERLTGDEDELNINDPNTIKYNNNNNNNRNIDNNNEEVRNINKNINHPEKKRNRSQSVENATSPTNEDDLDFCDNLENSLAKPLKIPPTRKTHHSNRSISNHHRSPSSLSNVHSYSPTASIVSELSDSNLNGPSSLTESFIDIKLNYSSSMDSNQSYEYSGKKARKDIAKINNNSSSNSIQYCTEEEVKDENEREGHIHTYNGITLLKTGEQMWVPGTQDLGFMTEDMLYEQEQLLEKLETSERAKLQSAHLKSDMQAFKAANPHAILEDFIRWHSPKDWIPDDSDDPNKGKLSPRMMAEGNLWQELWMSAKRVPVKRQKPIFKYNGEAEKALHYLEHLQIHELFIQLLPTIFLIAYDTLLTNPVVRDIKPVASSISKLAQELIRFPWNDVGLEYEAFSELIRSFKEIEMLMGKAFSLLRKLPKQYHLIERLLETPETQVLDGEERDSVYNLFMCGEARVSDLFPHPTTRELVLQATCLRPTPVPSRMYVSLNNDGMRIVDMVGKDTVFM